MGSWGVEQNSQDSLKLAGSTELPSCLKSPGPMALCVSVDVLLFFVGNAVSPTHLGAPINVSEPKGDSEWLDSEKVAAAPDPMYFTYISFLSMYKSDIWGNRCLIKSERAFSVSRK